MTYRNPVPQVPEEFPAQQQAIQPGDRRSMVPQPVIDNPHYKGSDKLKDRLAIITGGDSGIGRAAAIASAKEDADADETKRAAE